MVESKINYYSFYNCKIKPLFGDCVNYKKENKLEYPCVILMRVNNWNDYNYYSHFEVYYLSSDSEENINILGNIKIIESNAKDEKTVLPENFSELDKSKYFSRGSIEFYNNLNKFEDIKEKILFCLNDIHYFNYTKEKICSFDEKLSDPYDFSLFRNDMLNFNVSSEYAKDSNGMLNNIKELVYKRDNIEDEGNRKLMLRLLYGSIITCLESYLGDAFRYHIFENKSYFYSFLKNYDFPKGEKKYSWSELGLKGNKIGEFIEGKVKNVINDISFHNLKTVSSLYKDILNVKLPENWIKFNEAIQKRHDIFHRNGKTIAGNFLEIEVSDLIGLIEDVKKFIEETEHILLAQL